MIGPGRLAKIVGQNIGRNARHFVASAVGIVVGIAAFVFFLGLSGGVRRVVLKDIFPIDRIEVISPKTTLLGGSLPVNDALVGELRGRPEVRAAVPKMKMLFPAKGWGNLLGTNVTIEVGGFCDGIDPVLVAEQSWANLFQDFEETEKGPLPDCGPEPDNVCPTPIHQYCGWDRKCHRRVPILLSKTLLELYNGQFAPAHGMPKIGQAHLAALQQGVKKLNFKIALGESVVKGTTGTLKHEPYQVEAQVVGVSDKALAIGMTVPIGYVRRWNAEFVGPEAALQYSSIVVDVKDKDMVADLVSWVKAKGYETEESQAERFALVISIVTLLFVMISFVIVGLSAVNIAHTFFMIISERRREIGILRAIGASRGDVRAIILAEAALIGIVGGGLGAGLGLAAGKLLDWVSRRFVPEFPFKPTTYFDFTPVLLGGAIGFAVVFCLVGAFFPAARAARMQPAQALAS